MKKVKQAKVRTTYRHGNLKQALLDAALEMARQQGPEGVVLREATRHAGVAYSAAYRHYENQKALLDAVRVASLQKVAQMMKAELAALGAPANTVEYARQSLGAIGRGYLRFARFEPGLFRTAFVLPFEMKEGEDGSANEDAEQNPFQLLSMALDRMQEACLIDQNNRSQAEFLAWSAVHGMAMLILDGPLQAYSDEQLENLSERLLLMVERGLQA